MKGIERITDRIGADVQAEIDGVMGKAQAKADEIRQSYEAQAAKAPAKAVPAPQAQQCTLEAATERLLAAISGYAGRRGKSADDLFEQLEAKFPDKLSDANWLLLMAERYEVA